jgi:integrase
LTVEATVNEVDGVIVHGDGKTDSSVRTISVPQFVLDLLAEHLARTGRTEPSALVVQAPDGGPVRATNFRIRVYGPALASADLPGLTFHRLRHSAGHMMREAGVPLEVIQQRLGHKSIRTTADIYGSLPESIDRAVAGQLDGMLRSCDPDVTPALSAAGPAT